MLRRKVLFVAVTFVVALSGKVLADPVSKEHGHKTPHGGVVKEAEGMHVEFLIDKRGQPNLYMYDKAMRPSKGSNLEAKLTVKEHNGGQHTRVLKFFKDAKEGPLFTGEPINGLKDWDTAVVSLKLKDKWTHVRFSHH